VTVIVLPEARFTWTTPTTVHVVVDDGYDSGIEIFRGVSVVVTRPPPPSRTFPAGQLTFAVILVSAAADAAETTGVPVMRWLPLGPAGPCGPAGPGAPGSPFWARSSQFAGSEAGSGEPAGLSLWAR
jgi:hypothetical protein